MYPCLKLKIHSNFKDFTYFCNETSIHNLLLEKVLSITTVRPLLSAVLERTKLGCYCTSYNYKLGVPNFGLKNRG